MSNDLEKDHAHFLHYLTNLEPDEHRQTLAVLKRGLGSPPGEDVNMYRYVASFIPDRERGTDQEKIYYLVAALYAFHPLKTNQGDFGSHMALAASQMPDPLSTERRFTLLLNTHFSDLPGYLRQAVSFIRSMKNPETPIYWEALFRDLMVWDHPRKITQRKWANSFWGYVAPDAENPAQSEPTNGG